MAEYIDDDLLAEVQNDARAAGLDQKATNNLTQAVIRGAIQSHAALARQDDSQQAAADKVLQKYQLQQQSAQDLRSKLLGLAGPGGDEEQEMPITYGANPKTGTRAWNNMGWIADQPDQLESLDPRQRDLAQRYNAGPLAEARAKAARSGGGMPSGIPGGEPSSVEGATDVHPARDPFRPPSAIIEQRHAQVENNRLMLRKMLDAAQLMTQAKIPAQIQDLVLYQMFPDAARRKLTEDIARLREKEAIDKPYKDAALDARYDKEDRQAEYQNEVVRLRRSAEHNSKVKAYEDFEKIYNAAKSGGRTPPQDLLKMADRLARMQYDLIMNSEAFMGNRPAPYGLPREPAHDPYAGVTGAGVESEEQPWDWRNEPGAKTKAQLERDNLAAKSTPQARAAKQLEEVKRNSPGDKATIQRLERESKAPTATAPAPAAQSSAPRVVTNPDGSHTQPGFERGDGKPAKSRSFDIGGGRKFTIKENP
jgi:hypothetical protein